ncbi:MAG: hypothetical protein K2N43_03580 [Lachnospiraceae bacterium]|nr:hypothetical protein [Lachnospiraceae bacterium]
MKTIPTEFDKNITIQEAFFYGFFILLSLTKGLGFYEGQKVFILLTMVAFLFGILKLLVTPYTKRQIVTQILLSGLAVVVYARSRELAILFLAFTILGMKGISVKKTLHIALWVWASCAVVLSVFSFFRLEHTVYRVHAKMGLGHIFRWSLGFTHPNILHITYLMLCALLILELEEGYGFKQYILLMLGNLLVFFYSISYTGFGIVAVLLTGCLYVKFRPKFCLLEKAVANLVLPVCLILSFVLPFYLYDNEISGRVQQLNFMLNTRIWLAEQFLRGGYGSLFGRDVSQIVSSSMTLDNSYVWCYIHFGLIPTAIILAGYFALQFYESYKQRTRELVILACFLGAGWTEQLLFNTSFKNITLLFLGALLFSQKDGVKEYCLFPRFCERQIRVPLAGLPDRLFLTVRAVCQAHRGRIFGAAAAGAVLGILCCAFVYKVPEGYVAPRSYTDGMIEGELYLESADDPAYDGWKVMNYVDADTRMQLVTGKAVKLETARYYVGSVLIGGLLGAVGGIGWRKHEK